MATCRNSIFRRFKDRIRRRLAQWIATEQHRQWTLEAEKLKTSLKRCGSNFEVHQPFRIHCPQNISVGQNVHIGEGSFIRGEGGLTIGDNTIISRNLVLYTINHRYNGDLLPYDDQLVHKPVSIGRNVWIGMNVCIAPGTTIGDGAIIGLGAVVAGEIPPCAIVGSPKCRILSYRDKERYDELDLSQSYAAPSGLPLVLENRL